MFAVSLSLTFAGFCMKLKNQSDKGFLALIYKFLSSQKKIKYHSKMSEIIKFCRKSAEFLKDNMTSGNRLKYVDCI